MPQNREAEGTSRGGQFARDVSGADPRNIPTASQIPNAVSATGEPVSVLPLYDDKLYEVFQKKTSGQVPASDDRTYLSSFYGPNWEAVEAFRQNLKTIDRFAYSNLLHAWNSGDAKSTKAVATLIESQIWIDDERSNRATQSMAGAAMAEYPINSPFHPRYRKGQVREIAEVVAMALSLRDKLPKEWYDRVTMAWRSAIGPIHPDDDLVMWNGSGNNR